MAGYKVSDHMARHLCVYEAQRQKTDPFLQKVKRNSVSALKHITSIHREGKHKEQVDRSVL